MASNTNFVRGVAYVDENKRILRFFSYVSNINSPKEYELYVFRDINNNYIGLKPNEASKLKPL